MSFMNNLRKMVGMKPVEERTVKVKREIGAGAFDKLSKRYFASEDEQEKAALMKQMQDALPETLFLAVMCYEGEDPNAPVRDRDLHASTGAKRLYPINEAVVTNGNPGYRLAKRSDSRRYHLNTLVYHKTKEEWVPLFTDFTKLLPVFGQTRRVLVISFDEAKKMAKSCTGIVINPGKEAIKLDAGTLGKIR